MKDDNMWHTKHHKYEKGKLETCSWKQRLPERTTYTFNTILPGIDTVYFLGSQISNATVWNTKRMTKYDFI
jgi:hypothetical protein